jgi:ferritin-like metal-binding protein YciE
MKFNNLEELLVAELQDLINAEKQLVESLPAMEAAASSPDLKEAFRKHLAETKQQVKRLESCFNLLDASSGSEECEAMRGLIAEAKEIINSQSSAILKDAALIGAAQKVEHYEIAGYGTAKAHAKMLSLDEVADLLDENLEEEAAADKKLTKIAEGSFFTSGINKLAQNK